MKNLIIDGGNLLYRSFYSSKKHRYENHEGKDFTHIIVYLRILKDLVDRFDDRRIYIAWDIRNKGFVNFRQEGVEYKENRDRTEHELAHKFDKVIWKLTELLGITNIRAEKLEGDDIIYFLVDKYSDSDNIVVSTDGDFLQLFHNYDVKIYNPQKDVLITEKNSKQYNGGVDNGKFLFYKAIMGDQSDNIKGLYKYGPVKSKKFVENLKENFSNLSQEDRDHIKHNINMMNLKNGIGTYKDEGEYYESQDIKIDFDPVKFWDLIDRLGIEDYLGYRSEWSDQFDKSGAKLVDGLQNMLKNINN